MSDRILHPSWQRRIVTPTPLEEQEIERLNNALIEERKDRYNRFVEPDPRIFLCYLV